MNHTFMNYSMHHAMNQSAVNMVTTLDIGTSIITAFEAGGLSLVAVIFFMWVIRMVLMSRRNRQQS